MAVLAWAAPSEAKPWVAGTGAVLLAVFLVVSLYRHRQIRRLAEEIDEVLHSGRTVGFSNCREGDVAVLANELSKMVSRLSRTRDQLARERNALADSLADVSHQIRTPLTAITLMLPVVERADDARERKRAVRELESMIERVSWLVTTLLKIAKVDAGAMHVERREVSAAEVARRAVAPLATAMDLRDVNLVMELDEAATFQGDAPWTAEAVENIAKNCMEHTPPGGTVTRGRAGGRPGHHYCRFRHRPRHRPGGPAPHLRALLPGKGTRPGISRACARGATKIAPYGRTSVRPKRRGRNRSTWRTSIWTMRCGLTP